MAIEFMIALGAASIGLAIAIGALRISGLRSFRKAKAPKLMGDLETLTFLFQDKRLVDATGPGRALLAKLPGESDWQRLQSWLAMRLPQFATAMHSLGQTLRLELVEPAPEGQIGLRLLIENLGQGALRLTVFDPSAENAGVTINSLSLAAMEHEIELLRSTMDHSPMLAWREDAQRNLSWANSAYLELAEAMGDGSTVWPLPRLIDIDALPPRGTTGTAPRVQIDHDGQVRWYECHSHRNGNQTVTIALPADAAVRAERSLREFVQTLTKTFADLPIGLAIFDRDRNLQLFNPSLIDLTGLAAGFLTARPTLYAFLDRLREARMIPEPKDYRSWRAQMNTLEAAAASGRHVETWSLPGGRTYRVTGRPHPDGALAFLFDDITSETSLALRFRADISLGAEVLDAFENAVAVFGPTGRLAMSNSVFTTLWGGEAGIGLAEYLADWTERFGNSPGFANLRQALQVGVNGASSAMVQGAMAGPDGGLVAWTLKPLSGARTMLSFDHGPLKSRLPEGEYAVLGAGQSKLDLTPDAGQVSAVRG